MKITEITPEQAARFKEWTEKWIEIGLSTEPADFDTATAAALDAYRLCNIERPMIVLRVSSPYGATLGGAIAWAMLREVFGRKVESQVQSQVRSQVGAQVRSQVQSQVESQVESQVGAQVESQVWSGVYNRRGGAFWASWGAYVSFFRDVMGWTDPVLSRFKIDEDLTRSCGWVWWHENVLAISDRPHTLKRDAQGRLHCETGPSIAYRDGWSLWHWHGVAVPSEWITDRASLTPQMALTWKNVEQRRCACEMLGWHNILSALKAKSIDRDDDPEIGELVEVELPDSGKERFLRVLCGTGREFALPVPREMKTALDAQAWTWALDGKQFIKPEVRT